MILRTTRALAGSVLRALTILLLVILVGLALYVSVGRQLAPRVADYKNWLEQRLSQELGARVSIAQLSGEWLQFSPRFVLEDLRLGDENALYLERVSITPSLLESLKQRRLVIGSTDIQALEISMRQQSDGRWQLVGLSGSGPAVDSEMIFQLVTRLSHLSLTDASLQFEDSDGNTAALQQTRLDLQNNAGSHMLRVQAMFPDNPAILRAEAELTGSLLSELGGQVYVNFPQADYSIFMPALAVGGDTSASITNTDMAGEIWLELQQGQLHNLVLKARGGLALSSHSAGQAVEELTIENMQINSLHVSRDPATDAWGVYLDDLAFELDGQAWPQGDILFDYQPGQLARLQANALDLGILSRASVVLPVDQSLSAELTGFNPRGQLRQVALSAGFNGSTLDSISLTSNVSEGAISAFRGAPSFWGVDGYAEFNFDAASAQGSGFVEVDSSSLSMHLPNLFNDIWNYDRINGRVGFRVNTGDDVWIRIASGVIVAESDIVKARGQFATEIQLGDDRYIELELKLGALEADVGRKTPYLPTAPAAPQSVQGVLDWVDSAVLAGNGAGSGLIFRGRIQRGASAAERTLQMFYRVTDGTLKFDPAWPALEELDGTVLIDNGEVDIAASAGSTLGINFNSSVASVRPNPGGGRWLNVSGQGRGSAAQGLKYLQQTPVTEGIAQYFSNWTAEGDTNIELALSIPLYIEGARPEVSLAFDFADNRLFIPEYDLQLEAVTGRLIYTDDEGLRSESLTAQALGSEVAARIVAGSLASPSNAAPADSQTNGRSAKLSWTGSTRPEVLADWSGFPSAIKPLLTQFGGEIAYEAELELPSTGSAMRYPRLQLRSDMANTEVTLPAPFAKAAELTRDMQLALEFRPAGPVVDLLWQDQLQMNLQVADGLPQSGLIYLGPTSDGLRVRRLNPTAPGVEIIGALPQVDYAEWQQTFSEMFTSEPAVSAASSGSFDWLARLQGSAELSIGELLVAGENFEQLNASLHRESEGWRLGLTGDDVSGNIVYVLDRTQPWQIDLEYLHLGEAPEPVVEPEVVEPEVDEPEPVEPEVVEPALVADSSEFNLEDFPTVEYELPREDPLAALDPRNFPSMQLSVGQLTLSGADFGSWNFALESDDSGAIFRNLQTTARGLSIGSESAPAEFRWVYDGQVHRSVLNGQITAGDIGPVLSAYGYAPSLQSTTAVFDARLHWDGSPAFFSALGLSGDVDISINNGRFQQRAGVANSALRLISIINFDAVVRRLRLSDDLLRSGLSYDEITGRVNLSNGMVNIIDRLQIIGPASLFQVEGELDLAEQTIDADLYITLPVSDNIPWLGGLAVLNNLINWQMAIGVFLFDRIFGEQVDNLTSAQYTLEGPWDTVEPRLYQVFGSGS